MCAICGVAGVIDQQTLVMMRDVMAHRGPDDAGVYRDEHAALAARRLSIIDLETGHQPIANEDRTVWAVFNGEIYNHTHLRRQLEAAGHRFSTSCDTEVLVHLYEQYGDAGVHLLRGMFAYAIWDTRRRRLLLVRDRLGIKPLYYTETKSGLVFASEVKALLVHPDVEAAPNLDALDLYLTLQYVPGPDTMFAGIHKLLPGHMLAVEDGRVDVKRYWAPVFWIGERGVDFADAAEGLWQTLLESVKVHLQSDVPVGILLSGGLDSSAVTAAVTALGVRPKTFTVGFDIPGVHDERADARVVAQHLGTDHHEIVVRPDLADVLSDLVWHMDEPLADPAALPTCLLCRFVRKHVTVVLTGEGGDEVIGGYPRYGWFIVAKRLQTLLPARAREAALSLLVRLPFDERRKRGFANVLTEADDATRHVRWVSSMTSTLRASLLTPEAAAAGTDSATAFARRLLGDDAAGLGDIMHRLMALDLRGWLVDDVLMKVDKMSMAASVEARVPFLDHELVDYATTLPVSVKLRMLGTKALLRRAVRDRLPQYTVRRRKQAFMVPVDAWLTGPMRDFVHDVLQSTAARQRGWFRPDVIDMLLRSHSDASPQGRALWTLLCAELWARTFIDSRPSRSAPQQRPEVVEFAS